MNDDKQSSTGNLTTTDLLESWKEIASYLKRGVRTVRRWEKEEGLPVHRQLHKTLGSVYARKSELDAWRESRRVHARQIAAPRRRIRYPSPRLMIAVLPFDNISGESDQDYIADGLTDEMIGHLGRLNPEHLGVIARTTVMQFKGSNRTVRQIANELNVDYVVEGSMRREGDRLRVNAQLIHVHDQAQVWSRAYEHRTRSILSLQRDLAADVGREIRMQLSPERRASLPEIGAVNPDAYFDYLKGRQLLNAFTPESVRRSVECFRRAIDRDPAHAPSYAALAEAYERLPMWIDEPAGNHLPLALEAAEHALRLDPDLPEAYASLGVIHANYLWNWTQAEAHFQRALELNPSCLPARHWYAEFLAELGRIDEALEIVERSQKYDPLSPLVQATRAFVLWLGRRFDEAIAEAQLVLDIEPGYPMALIRLGAAYAGKGMYAEAVGAFRRAVVAAPALLDCKALLGYALGQAGETQQAVKQLDELRQLAGRRYVPAFLLAGVHLGLGEYDEAMELIENEYHARGWYLLLIKHAPQFDPLRSQPRFLALIERMQFPN